MTEHLRSELVKIKREDTELTVTCPDAGPVAIEAAYDEALAVPPTLKLVQKADEQGYDAAIIACFSDPGIEAAKEIANILVVGIQEAALHVAAMLGAKFTILTPMRQRIPHKYREVRRYKMEQALASVRALDMSVTETDADPEGTKKRILEVSRQAAEQDGAEVIILGCAGMVGYAEDVTRELGLVVLDPSSVALKICEGMVDAKLMHSKRALFAKPPAKEYKGMK
ncbi:Hydantoin racemase [subsurface metagenome]